MFPPLRVGGRDGPAPPRSLFSLAFTTQMIVTTPVSQSFSQASQPGGHVFDASSTGGHCCCCALGTAVRWLPLELATAHCYGNCWRPQQPPPQGGGERAGVLRNSKTKHRTVKSCQKPLLPRIELCWIHKCLMFVCSVGEPRLFHKSHKSDRWRSCCLAARLREPRLCSFQPK